MYFTLRKEQLFQRTIVYGLIQHVSWLVQVYVPILGSTIPLSYRYRPADQYAPPWESVLHQNHLTDVGEMQQVPTYTTTSKDLLLKNLKPNTRVGKFVVLDILEKHLGNDQRRSWSSRSSICVSLSFSGCSRGMLSLFSHMSSQSTKRFPQWEPHQRLRKRRKSVLLATSAGLEEFIYILSCLKP